MPRLTDPRQYQFWSDEERRLWDHIAPTLLNLVFHGGKTGAEALPERVQVLVNWDVFNQKAIDYLNSYRLSWWNTINETTRNQTVKAIDDWIRGGEHIDTLARRIEPIFSGDRARRVAVTEVTRVFAEGNRAAWKATGYVTQNRWNTVEDERVCPICAPLDGMVRDLDEGFTTEEGEGILAPAAHVNCRCFLTPVVDVKALEGEFERILEED